MLITPQKSAEIAREYLKRAQTESVGYGTGLHELDRQLSGGIKQGELVVVAGRPGCGKSIFLYHVANHNAEEGKPWLFVSAEMTAEQLEVRGVARRAKIDSRDLLEGKFEWWPDVDYALEVRATVPLYLLASTLQGKNRKLTVKAIRKVLDKLVSQTGHGVEGICVDYLQRLRSTQSRERRHEINEITWDLKSVALEYSLPVFLGCQVGRQVDTRNPPVPILSDMKESGEIEENADIVVSVTDFSKYYDVGTVIPGSNSAREVSGNELTIGILKQRMGITNKWVRTYYDPRYSFLADMARESEERSMPF